MSSAGWYIEFTGIEGGPEDPLWMEVSYSNTEEMRKMNTANKPQ